jgi:hypothetical protein
MTAHAANAFGHRIELAAFAGKNRHDAIGL